MTNSLGYHVVHGDKRLRERIESPVTCCINFEEEQIKASYTGGE
jgi:hypothetical protein